ncbi:sulfite exporter TauE/SafE family protein [Dendrosporobacter sp. 1207_IL3150]|uniref:sulfite exporter TauE/SafE family protein n=1 Tax=Dendrosporobacter sp. 1207_IL3150 TaxID=3084054 RepID=UPI002FDB07BE
MITILVIILTGLAAGVLSGLLGVGGGVILIPAMYFILGIDQHTAQGISLVVIIPTALAGVWRLQKENLIDFKIVIYVSIGAIFGALISASLVQTVSTYFLRTGFGLFIIAIGIKTLVGLIKSKKTSGEQAK